jgi:hypothetical protein
MRAARHAATAELSHYRRRRGCFLWEGTGLFKAIAGFTEKRRATRFCVLRIQRCDTPLSAKISYRNAAIL